MIKGQITGLNKNGYGFINGKDLGDIFFHMSKLEGISFDQLYKGMMVEVHGTEPGRNGRLSALKVCPDSDNVRSSSNKEYRFLNQYNFVRFVEPVSNQGEETPKEKMLGRINPPTHDRMLGLNGVIKCQVTAETPLFVSDSHGVEEPKELHRSYRFFEYGGQKAIPASSLRGMVRSVFEAVTNSCFSVFDIDRKLSYHAPVSEARELVPARVEKKKGGGYRLCLLTGTTGYKPNGLTRNDMIYAAWVKLYRKTVDHRANKTAKENPGSPYAKRKELNLNPEEYRHKSRCYALLEEMVHPEVTNRKGKKSGYFKFWNVKEVNKKRENLSAPGKGEEIEEGWLCITFQNTDNKHDERFFFRSKKNQDIGVIENISDDIIKDYNLLLEDYRKRHSDNVKNRKKPDQVDWDKRDPEPAFSRFIISEEKLEDGDLVYARLDGNAENPQVKYIVPVSMPRVTYKKRISELLPKDFHPCREIDKLCPACRLFGWVKGDKKNDVGDVKEVVSYKGRLSFEHAVLQKPAGNSFDEMPLTILSSPKPTTERFYLLPKEDLEKKKWFWKNTGGGYNNGSNKLRGRKFYRHHGKVLEEDYRVSFRSEQNRSVRGVLSKHSKFTFSIKFHNLSPLELGALLWTLELDGKGFHRLGYAKPLGFGSIKVKVLKVNIVDSIKRYSSIRESGIVPLTEASKEDCIHQFKEAMCSKFAQDEFEKIANVRDIMSLSQAPGSDLPIHYPRPNERPRDDDPSFNWFIGNNRKCCFTLPTADKDDFGLPLIDKNGNLK